MIFKLDAYGFSYNPSPLEENLPWLDITEIVIKAVQGGHAPTYLILIVDLNFEEPNQGANVESKRAQVIGDVWNDIAIPNKLQYMKFSISILTMELD